MKNASWTRRKIVAFLRKLEREDGFAGSDRIDEAGKRFGLDLRSVIRQRFGGLTRLKKAAGLKTKTRWTRESIVCELQAILRRGEGVRRTDLHANHPALEAAATRAFGTLRQALEASGITPDRLPMKRTPWRWPRERIVAVLREAWEKRRDVRIDPLREKYAGLYLAARREFGTWRQALAAAGLPKKVYANRMAASRVARAFQTRGGADISGEQAADDAFLSSRGCDLPFASNARQVRKALVRALLQAPHGGARTLL